MYNPLLSATAHSDLTHVKPELIPTRVSEVLFEDSKRYTNKPGLRPQEFDDLLISIHANGNTSWVAQHDKTYSTNGQTERLFYFVDMSTNGEIVGRGEVRFALTDTSVYFKNKPFVGWLSTRENFRRSRQGNLLGRLLLMREVTESKLDLPLYSDTLISYQALRVAKRLVRMRLAEQVEEEVGIRFKALSIMQ